MTLMTKLKPITENIFPFKIRQLRYFKNEIEQAGGFHQLMFQKNALELYKGMKFIRNHRNKYLYRSQYLKGIYESLKPFYDTEIPFVFWSAMYETLQRYEKNRRPLF
jgi:hypothetical protein